MDKMTGLDFKIKEMAARIRELREIEGLSVADMAGKTGVTEAEYVACENGESDLNFAFIYRCALAFNVDVTSIIEGNTPKLTNYVYTKAGKGQKIEKAHGMTYYNLAAKFKNKIAEPLFVEAVYSKENENKDIELTSHDGQELDIVIEGKLKVQVGEHSEILGPGDSIYYDSNTPHGMIAVDGKDCTFYAIVLNPNGEPIPELQTAQAVKDTKVAVKDTKDRLYKQFIDVEENENGTPTSIKFKNIDNFNFAYDLIDALADKEPDKLAMLHISRDKTERRFTFKDMKKASAQAANYFKSLGIKKGDRVMLILKRHYQYWFAMLGLYLIGKIKFSHDADLKYVSVPRFFLALISFSFALYMIPGLWGAPLKSISAFAPPLHTQDFNLYGGESRAFDDYDEGMKYAEANNLPVLVDFTGYGCVNCRKMESAVFDTERIQKVLGENYVLITLVVDDRKQLETPYVVNENGKDVLIETVGDKWSYLQRHKFQANSQPYYIVLDNEGLPLTTSRAYDPAESVDAFETWLLNGVVAYKNNK